MSSSRSLKVSDQHLSRTTADLIRDRIERGNGTAFFRRGDKMQPMFGDMTFRVDTFSALYEADPERLERALPHDLLFLHLHARQRGFDEMIITNAVDPDPDLPIYLGNALHDLGDILRDQEVKVSERKPRQLPESDRIMGISPRQIRDGRVTIVRPDPSGLEMSPA